MTTSGSCVWRWQLRKLDWRPAKCRSERWLWWTTRSSPPSTPRSRRPDDSSSKHLLALEAADRLISGRRHRTTLYVNLEPCLMCLGAAFTAKVGTVVYGLESPSDGGVAAFEHCDEDRVPDGMPGYALPELCGGVLREEAAVMFREYASMAEEGSWAAAWAHDLGGLARH
jgi:hypothetical protein